MSAAPEVSVQSATTNSYATTVKKATANLVERNQARAENAGTASAQGVESTPTGFSFAPDARNISAMGAVTSAFAKRVRRCFALTAEGFHTASFATAAGCAKGA